MIYVLSTRADVETGQLDSEEKETLSHLIPSKKMNEMVSDRYIIWKNDTDFILFDRVVPRMDFFESSLANFNSKSILKRFLAYFPVHFIEKINCPVYL